MNNDVQRAPARPLFQALCETAAKYREPVGIALDVDDPSEACPAPPDLLVRCCDEEVRVAAFQTIDEGAVAMAQLLGWRLRAML